MRGQRWGHVINVSSMAGVVAAVPNRVPYAASKAATDRAHPLDGAGRRGLAITVNAICPGAVGTTRRSSARIPAWTWTPSLPGRVITSRWAGIGRPGDVAAAVAYLVDAGADYMTGQILVLDGGAHSAFPIPRPPDPE